MDSSQIYVFFGIEPQYTPIRLIPNKRIKIVNHPDNKNFQTNIISEHPLKKKLN